MAEARRPNRPRAGDDRSGRNRSGGNRSGRSGAAKPGRASNGSEGRGAGGRGGQSGTPRGKRSGSASTGRGGQSAAKGGRRAGSSREQAATPRRRRDLKGAAVDLPNWVVEELSRTTPNHRVADALEALGEASAAFSDGRYPKALRHALRAKELAPRDATVREVLGLAAYRTGDWKQALRELRTYRRLSGEVTHLPIEMDALRALDRPDEVAKAWTLLNQHGARPEVMKEARVVYASFLIDAGDLAAARTIVESRRLSDRPFEEDMRVWYVAARAAALDGDAAEARRLRNAILEHDPSFPGIDELETLIARAG